MVCTVGGDPGAAKIARDRTRTEQQIAEAIIFNEKNDGFFKKKETIKYQRKETIKYQRKETIKY